MNAKTKCTKVFEALILIPVLVFASNPANAETLYAQSILHEIGDWVNVADLLGSPDGKYAWTANSDPTVWGKSTGAAVWLDFGKIIHSGTIVIYHDDPAGHYTNLGVGVWHFWYPHHPWYAQPRQVPLASDEAAHNYSANIQGTGVVTCYTATRDFRYVRLDHFTTDPNFQDGIDAVAVIEGDAPRPGVYLDPPPETVEPPIRPVSQRNNGYWSNPGAILGEPDGIYAWSRNPQHTMPRLIVDLGRVVYSGQIVFHHNKPHPGVTSLGVYINSEEYDPDPATCPDMLAPVGEGWEKLTNAHGPSGACTLQFPPTRFRYIYFAQSQCFPGQEDGIDAIEVYESPELVTIEATVDIDPDVLNLKSRGKWITCYIWLPEGYDVSDISNILLEDNIEPRQMWSDEKKQVMKTRFSREEVQGVLEPGEVELTVSGELLDGTKFEGSDTIRVIDKGAEN